MKHNVSTLSGALLDAAVAKAAGKPFDLLVFHLLGVANGTPQAFAGNSCFSPSESWEDGGPIIERERITLGAPGLMKSGLWEAFIDAEMDVRLQGYEPDLIGRFTGAGPTPLVAAMRAYVASKFGEEVELP